MSRPLNAFEKKSITDYNKATTTGAVRYSCVRAKELDDAQGAPQTGTYFTAMLDFASAIHAELGYVPVTSASKSDESLLAQIAQQEEELVEQDAAIEVKDKEIDTLNNYASEMACKIKKLTADNKKLTTTNKKLTKGAK